MSYDTRCHALAQVFLADVLPPSPTAEKMADELAQEIQDVIESFLAAYGPKASKVGYMGDINGPGCDPDVP
jgi:hypothetical protein